MFYTVPELGANIKKCASQASHLSDEERLQLNSLVQSFDFDNGERAWQIEGLIQMTGSLRKMRNIIEIAHEKVTLLLPPLPQEGESSVPLSVLQDRFIIDILITRIREAWHKGWESAPNGVEDLLREVVREKSAGSDILFSQIRALLRLFQAKVRSSELHLLEEDSGMKQVPSSTQIE